MDLEEVARFLRLEYSELTEEEKADLLSLQIAVEEYFGSADIPQNYAKRLYKLAVKTLLAHWYDNRAIIGDSKQIPFSLTCMITQLQYGGGQ